MSQPMYRQDEITTNHLAPKTHMFVKGKISYSRLTSHFRGEDLNKRIADQRDKLKKKHPTKVPHTTISLYDAHVLTADPSNPSLADRYVQQSTYQSKSGKHAGSICYSIDDKSPNLPAIFAPIPDNERVDDNTHRQIHLEGELASGVEVIIILEVFSSPKGNNGVGINRIILTEQPRYYQGSDDLANELSAIGVKIKGGITPVQAPNQGTGQQMAPGQGSVPQQGFAPTQQAPEQAIPAGSDMSQGMPMPPMNVFGQDQQAPSQQTQQAPNAYQNSQGNQGGNVFSQNAPMGQTFVQPNADEVAQQLSQQTPFGGSAFDVNNNVAQNQDSQRDLNPWADAARPGIDF